MQPCVVELPESEFITCHALALTIASALFPNAPDGGTAESHERASWIPRSPDKLIEPSPHISPGPLEQIGKDQIRQPLMASPPNNGRPLLTPTLERRLDECKRRLIDLQAWVVHKELSIFTASRTKARHIAPGAYLRRTDAIRYCEESGLEVRGQFRPVAQERPTARSPEPVNPHTSSPEPGEPDLMGTTGKESQPRVFSPAPLPSRPTTRLLRPKEAILRTGLSRSSFYERQNRKSRYFDATFPNSVQIGQSAMGYREDELDIWIASRPPKDR